MNITIESLSFTYPGGVQALRGVNLVVDSGQALALVGENGAGKTTLAKHLNGLLKPDNGSVHIGDWDTTDRSVAKLAARVGFAFQNPDDQLFARTVGDEVAFGPRNLGRDEDTVLADVNRALQWVGLLEAADLHPYDLQAAERKRVAMAAVLAMRTPVIILDEPTMGQDAHGLAQLGQIIQELQNEGRTVITISHDIEFCAAHFQRIVVMADGHIIADGPAQQVLAQEDLLREANVEPPQLIRLASALKLPGKPLTVNEFLQTLTSRNQQKE